jgi:hypothetical protein
MIDFSQDFLGLLHPQDQFSWFPYACAQIHRLDHRCIRRQEILNCRRRLILGGKPRHEQASRSTANENMAGRHERHLN